MRARMKGNEDDLPMIVCFSTCVDSIRTIPALQHDYMRPEDLDTTQEDHCGDDWRYGCMSRPYVTDKPEPEKDPLSKPTFSEIIHKQIKKSRSDEGYI